MVEWTVFPNAPITEALLDIRVQLPPEVNLAQLATFYDCVKQHYPIKRERRSWQGGFKLNPPGNVEVLQSQGGPYGYLFASTDGKQIVQARLDGFTLNRLKPYENWETFRDQARQLWGLYVQVAHPRQITRAALRYINRIEIPLPMKDFKDYILTLPEIAPGLPQSLERFLMQLVIPVLDTPAKVVITQTIEPVTDANRVPLIFDIDVFREAVFDIEDEEMWQVFEKLRALKNDIFFKSTTSKAKELFK